MGLRSVKRCLPTERWKGRGPNAFALHFALMPPLNALKAFGAAARSESFTRAAEELIVPQGAVSHQVKALEEAPDVRLFKRERQYPAFAYPVANTFWWCATLSARREMACEKAWTVRRGDSSFEASAIPFAGRGRTPVALLFILSRERGSCIAPAFANYPEGSDAMTTISAKSGNDPDQHVHG
jgi:Bacterial regulatory helix-turn-helix protein, lysR family